MNASPPFSHLLRRDVLVAVTVTLTLPLLTVSHALAQCAPYRAPVYEGGATHRHYKISYGPGVNPTSHSSKTLEIS